MARGLTGPSLTGQSLTGRRRGAAAGAALVCVLLPGLVAGPLLAQQGGRLASLSLSQGIETTRDVDNTGTETARSLATTNLSLRLSSETRSAGLSLTLGAQLRAAEGDLATGQEAVEIDQPRLGLTYRLRRPGAIFETAASVERRNVGFLRAVDLITLPDGSVGVPDDIDDLDREDSGLRTNTRLRFAAQFGENRPFGWGLSLSNSDLSYTEAEGSGFVDSSSTALSLTGRLDVTEVLTVTSGARVSLRTAQDGPARQTSAFDLGLGLARAEGGSLSARLGVEAPEEGDARLTLSLGARQEVDAGRALDFTLGATRDGSGGTSLTGGLNYTTPLLPTLDGSARISRGVRENADNEVVLDTAARFNLRKALTGRSDMAFGVTFGERDTLDTDARTATTRLSLSYSHALTEDWALSVGASQTLRDETGLETETSERLFFSLRRSWSGRF